MVKNKLLLSFKLACILLFLSRPVQAMNFDNLTIFSEPNMTYALTQIAQVYSKKENVAISINFNSSFELIDNIDLGEPADIFVSSHADWIKNLSQKGLVDRYNSLSFAKDNLVLITSKNNTKIDFDLMATNKDLKNILQIISEKKIPLIVDSDYTSLGKYTKGILAESNINDFQIFQKVGEDKKSILNFLGEYNDYCAILMKSEISGNENVVILSEIPVAVDYQALVIASDNMESARKFIEYLKSDEAKATLVKNGFVLN